MSDSMSLYVVYDRVAQIFNPPFAATNNAVAIRMFRTNCQHPDLKAIKEDLDLYVFGALDAKTGEFSGPDKPEFLYRYSDEV